MSVRAGLTTTAVCLLLLAGLGGLVAATFLADPPLVPVPDAIDATDDEAAAATPWRPMTFGLDARGALQLRREGSAPDVGTLWVGQWNLDHGWKQFDSRLAALDAAGIRPAIQFYYWGDDVAPACLESGCAGKDIAGWYAAADGLSAHLADRADSPLIVLETEFNKADVARHEPLDEALAAMAEHLRSSNPGAEIVLGLGNWNRPAWTTWDRAAAASDAIGIQALRATTRHGDLDVHDDLLAAAQDAQRLWAKPIVLHDVGVSSYPDASPEQATAIAALFDALPALRDAGVEAILYRSWRDAPGADARGYFGPAEQRWGLADETGAHKPAAAAWLDGVQRTRQT